MTLEMGESELMSLLCELGERLSSKGTVARIYIVGGAAMLLAYGRETLTRNIDAIFEPKSVVYAEARAIAAERGISEDWFNDGVKGFVPGPDRFATTSIEVPGMSVEVASAERMLAMKVAAARGEQDASDILRLCEMLHIRSIEQALSYAYREYGKNFPLRSKFFVYELLQEHLPANDPLSVAPPNNPRALVHDSGLERGPSRAGGSQPQDVAVHVCGELVASARMPCILSIGHRGNHRSR